MPVFTYKKLAALAPPVTEEDIESSRMAETSTEHRTTIPPFSRPALAVQDTASELRTSNKPDLAQPNIQARNDPASGDNLVQLMLLNTLNDAEDQIDRELARLQSVSGDLHEAKKVFNAKKQAFYYEYDEFKREKQLFQAERWAFEAVRAQHRLNVEANQDLSDSLEQAVGTIEETIRKFNVRQKELDKLDHDVFKRAFMVRAREAAVEIKEQAITLSTEALERMKASFEAEKKNAE